MGTKDGKISVILCIGRWIRGNVKWKANLTEFEVFQPFDSFLSGIGHYEASTLPAKYFYGLDCSFIPPRPDGPVQEPECVWAIKLGKFFIDGGVKNDILSTNGVRECIQRIYGKRTHTLKC